MDFVAPSTSECRKCLGYDLAETRTRYTGWFEKREKTESYKKIYLFHGNIEALGVFTILQFIIQIFVKFL